MLERVKSAGGVAAFIDVRVGLKSDRYWVDDVHHRRLRLLIGRANEPTLVCVKAVDTPDDWQPLPAEVRVVHAYKARRFSYFSWLVMWLRCVVTLFPLVRRSGLIMVMYTSSPLSYAGIVLALALRKRLVTVLIGRASRSYDDKGGAFALGTAIKSFATRITERLISSQSRHILAAAGLAREIRGAIPFSTSGLTENDFLPDRSILSRDTIEWLFVGTVNHEKGVDTLLRALALARQKDKRHRAILVGDLDPRFAVISLIDQLNLVDAVQIVGPIPRHALRDYLARVDLFVFLSLHEGMPRAPLEALAAGIPCIVTATGADIYVEHLRSGVIVPLGAPDDVASAVERVVCDEALRNRLISGARAAARQFTYAQAVMSAHEALIKAEVVYFGAPDRWCPDA